MGTKLIIESIGYCGSLLVLLSFLMASVVKLRLINSLGSLIFMIYALIIKSYPTALMNACLVLINMHFLWKMRTSAKEYSVLRVSSHDAFLTYILNLYREDIERCFPCIALDFNKTAVAYIVCCKGMAAGVTVGVVQDSVMEVLLDYSTPEYRDFSIGTFLMTQLFSDGIQKLVYRGPTEHHHPYLKKMGFENVDGVYEKKFL